MDDLRTRLNILEHHMHALHQYTHTVTRQLRWWRGLACGLLVLALLSLTWKPGTVADAQSNALADQLAAFQNEVAALRDKLRHITVAADEDGVPEVVISGANLRIVNSLGATATRNGAGNLIVGYNEPRGADIRIGSHNIVVGQRHNFSSFGGLVVGDFNTISGDFAVVSGGAFNTASGNSSSVSGGAGHTASGNGSSVSGGAGHTASGNGSSVSGGQNNTASGGHASVSGGLRNTASGANASVSGGLDHTASGDFSSVSGGQNNTASGEAFSNASVSGGAFNTASGLNASVSGGENNIASGNFSSVSGGSNRTAPGEHDWAAGPLFADF